jgi:hypothetical protein
MLMAENRWIYMRYEIENSRMVTEEPSVIAAVSNGAWMTHGRRRLLDFVHTGPVMRAQVHVTGLTDPVGARQVILLRKDELTRMANDETPCWLSKEAGKGPGGPYNRVHKNRVVGAFHSGSSFHEVRSLGLEWFQW